MLLTEEQRIYAMSVADTDTLIPSYFRHGIYFAPLADKMMLMRI